MKYIVTIKVKYCTANFAFDDISEACSFMSVAVEKWVESEDTVEIGMTVEKMEARDE